MTLDPREGVSAERRIAEWMGVVMFRILLVSLLLAGCASGDDGSMGIPDATVSDERTLVTIQNRTSWDMDMLFVSPCTDPHWGHNLIAGSYLAVGADWTSQALAPGCYDLALGGFTGYLMGYDFDVHLEAGDHYYFTSTNDRPNDSPAPGRTY